MPLHETEYTTNQYCVALTINFSHKEGYSLKYSVKVVNYFRRHVEKVEKREPAEKVTRAQPPKNEKIFIKKGNESLAKDMMAR